MYNWKITLRKALWAGAFAAFAVLAPVIIGHVNTLPAQWLWIGPVVVAAVAAIGNYLKHCADE
jgi:hypothetical protein